jgi:hypothetical protein
VPNLLFAKRTFRPGCPDIFSGNLMDVRIAFVIGSLGDTDNLAVGALEEVVLDIETLFSNDEEALAGLETDDAGDVEKVFDGVAALKTGHDFAVLIFD